MLAQPENVDLEPEQGVRPASPRSLWTCPCGRSCSEGQAGGGGVAQLRLQVELVVHHLQLAHLAMADGPDGGEALCKGAGGEASHPACPQAISEMTRTQRLNSIPYSTFLSTSITVALKARLTPRQSLVANVPTNFNGRGLCACNSRLCGCQITEPGTAVIGLVQ